MSISTIYYMSGRVLSDIQIGAEGESCISDRLSENNANQCIVKLSNFIDIYWRSYFENISIYIFKLYLKFMQIINMYPHAYTGTSCMLMFIFLCFVFMNY